ncbi:metal-binding protein [Leptothermofonsia sichuanensis E412]|uniref:metal-binding protein n=1 Tax=Leptothermofonsia sichuanensis TaxID=2917832 RepID=UPI001CA6216D|nr:metal-binding protein [Leptothermofonsia sichuanensis]QZZ23139.1 metal-binding protein [Leptothermofonsia sichuanensis E412]
MPSGQTHDSITLWSLPLVAGLTFERTQSSGLTLMVSGGFLFSGLMFGPDLDIYSRQYRRWGPLRWIWLPYQRGMRHRSLLSHGPLVGTALRILYLMVWLGALGFGLTVLGAIAFQWLGIVEQWHLLAYYQIEESTAWLGQVLQRHPAETIALAIGLELGGVSHSLSDWVESIWKRHRVNRQFRTRIQGQISRYQPPQPTRVSFRVRTPETERPRDYPFIRTVSSRIQSYFQEKPVRSPKPVSSPVPPHLQRSPQLPPFIRQRKP